MAGYGDELIGSGLARGAWLRGRRVAFGADRRKILWGPHSAEIFKNNPNIAPPGSESDPDIEWIPYYKGHRLYNVHQGPKWVWNYNFLPNPGEVFLDQVELDYAQGIKPGFVLIEPNVPWHKIAAVNKDWGLARYQSTTNALRDHGYQICQFAFGRNRLRGKVTVLSPPTFRHAMAVLQRAALVIAPEGGLHHAAAAVWARAVVIFGGWIPPEATGYSTQVNLTGGAVACGLLKPCAHCRDAMAAITVDSVVAAALKQMRPYG